jgi:O-antigen/teichoic acid export membrane protein
LLVTDEASPPVSLLDDQSLRGRFALNVLSSLVMLGLNVATGLWLTPYLITHLGVAVFGLVPLAASVTAYLSIVNSALNSAVGRFLTIDIRRGLLDVANRTFNTSLWGSIALAAGFFPVVVGFSVVAPDVFDMPPGQEEAASWLFGMVMVSYFVGLVRSAFSVAAFASNRFDLQNAITASNLVVRLLMIVLLFQLAAPQVWHVGVGTVVGVVASLGIAVMVWRRLLPELRVDRHAFDRSRLADLFAMSGWMMINQVGTLLFLNMDLIIVNLFLGAEAEGRYGSVMQWPVLLRTFASTVAAVLTPVVLAHFARQDLGRITRISQQAVKLLGLSVALPVGLVCGLSRPLLRVWLGPDFSDLAILLSTLTLHLCVNLAVMPLFSVQVTLGKVKWPGIVTLVMGLVNLGLATWWVGLRADGLGVALAGAVVLTLKNAVFTPIYGAHILKIHWSGFTARMVPGILGAVGVGLAGYWLTCRYPLDNWGMLAAAAALVSVIYAGVVFLVVLNREDRQLLRGFVPV